MENSKKTNLFKWLNTIAFLGVIIVNALANILPINGQATGDISDSYKNLFVPAGITFAVWGVIYLLLALFVLYQWGLVFKGENTDKVVNKIGYLFVISSMANITWIFSWHYNEVFLSLSAMLVILASLIAITMQLSKFQFNPKENLAVKSTFTVYLGWIAVATVANFTAFFVNINWNGFGISESIWTMVMILVASILCLIGLRLYKNIAYALVTIWAIAGILIKHLTFYNGIYIEIIICSVVCMILIAICIINKVFFRKEK